jgi:cellulose synthase/poly-beta-1,6-N-acetylglucosamine synthase-like glycosyltransferase
LVTDASDDAGTRVVALLPAHNEEASLPATVASLQRQTRVPDLIVVLADRCTDGTADVARALGCEVFETRDNTAKKAGALNQGLAAYVPGLRPGDYVLVVDADSVLCPSWLSDALDDLADPSIGAVSGAYIARRGRGIISLLQRAEYAQERRRISRRGGNVDVLSGTCALFEVGVLTKVAEQRGTVLPGSAGQYYDESSLTEDFEITLALKQLGYDPHCFKHLKVVTDVMETWSDLFRQRLRWQRGTIETLGLYGLTPLTRRLWAVQVLTYSSTVLVLGMLGLTSFVLASGAHYDPRWLALVPLFAVEQVVSSWRGGVGARVVAALLLPMWCYDVFRLSTYWVALSRSLRRADAAWS